jgi:protein phosphatase
MRLLFSILKRVLKKDDTTFKEVIEPMSKSEDHSLISEKTAIAYGATHPGLKRQNNEDAFKILFDKVFIVADGMGGHQAGEVASQSAVQIISEYFTGETISNLKGNPSEIEKALKEVIEHSHERIKKLSETKPEYQGMGTTIVLAYIEDRTLYTAHIGDSRVYVINDNVITQITNDHSVVWELYMAGKITKEEARLSILKNRITQALGYSPDLVIETHRYELKEGDLVLLCTDGLWDMLSDEEILKAIHEDGSLEEIGKRLIFKANEAGGADNITIIIIKP